MDVRLTWTDCDESGDYVVPNVLSPWDLISRPDNMDETVLHTYKSLSCKICPCSKIGQGQPRVII